MNARPPVIIGAGWSGLACAIELAAGGMRPVVIDAAPRPGGRAREVELALGDRRFRLDNGQHLLLGAYRETLRLMRQVGVEPARVLRRLPFTLRYPDGWRLSAVHAPAPLHLALGLLSARGPSLGARASLAAWVLRHRRAGWQVQPPGSDAPAAMLFSSQPQALRRRIWRPLCLAALNVEPEHASAAIMLNVLRDSLGAAEGASHILLPRGDRSTLSALFPDRAAEYLGRAGVAVRFGEPALGVAAGDTGWRVGLRGSVIEAGTVVLALPPDRAAALLHDAHPLLAPAVGSLRALRHAPIATVYLRYAADMRLRAPFYALLDDADRDRYGQWVFDRGALDPQLEGILSVVISGGGRHAGLERTALAAAVVRQLGADLGMAAPMASAVVVERRATLVPAPGLSRPSARLPVPGLYLAGDGADSPYPSTIEGSVRSGVAAARALLAASGPRR